MGERHDCRKRMARGMPRLPFSCRGRGRFFREKQRAPSIRAGGNWPSAAAPDGLKGTWAIMFPERTGCLVPGGRQTPSPARGGPCSPAATLPTPRGGPSLATRRDDDNDVKTGRQGPGSSSRDPEALAPLEFRGFQLGRRVLSKTHYVVVSCRRIVLARRVAVAASAKAAGQRTAGAVDTIAA